jgi:hypothetical protein
VGESCGLMYGARFSKKFTRTVLMLSGIETSAKLYTPQLLKPADAKRTIIRSDKIMFFVSCMCLNLDLGELQGLLVWLYTFSKAHIPYLKLQIKIWLCSKMYDAC